MTTPASAAALAAAILLASAGASQAAVLRDGWAAKPTEDQVRAVWPKADGGKPLKGEGVILCNADLAGALSGCRSIFEEPAGAGIGPALIILAQLYRAKPSTEACVGDGGQVVFAQGEPDPPRHSGWRAMPDLRRLMNDYPKSAAGHRFEGYAIMRCLEGEKGDLVGCRVLAEAPDNLHFGAAALRIAPEFKRSVVVDPAHPEPQSVIIPMRYRMWPIKCAW